MFGLWKIKLEHTKKVKSHLKKRIYHIHGLKDQLSKDANCPLHPKGKRKECSNTLPNKLERQLKFRGSAHCLILPHPPGCSNWWLRDFLNIDSSTWFICPMAWDGTRAQDAIQLMTRASWAINLLWLTVGICMGLQLIQVGQECISKLLPTGIASCLNLGQLRAPLCYRPRPERTT